VVIAVFDTTLSYLVSEVSNLFIIRPCSLEGRIINCCTMSVCLSRASDFLEIGKP